MQSENYRVTVNLTHFFQNYKSLVYVFISKTIHTIKDLQDKISVMFKIKDFYLRCDGKFIHPAEDVRILKNDDCVWAVPLDANEKVEETILVEQKRLQTENSESFIDTKNPIFNSLNIPEYLLEGAENKSHHKDQATGIKNGGLDVVPNLKKDEIKYSNIEQSVTKPPEIVTNKSQLQVENNETQGIKKTFILDYNKCNHEYSLLTENMSCMDESENRKSRLKNYKNSKNCLNKKSTKIQEVNVVDNISPELLNEKLEEHKCYDEVPILKKSCKRGAIDFDSLQNNIYEYENSNTNSYPSEVKFNKQEQADLETQKDKMVNTEVKSIDCYTPVKEKMTFENSNLPNENIIEKNCVQKMNVPTLKRSFDVDSIDVDSFLNKVRKYKNSKTNSYSSEVKFNKQEPADLETQKDKVINTEVKIKDSYPPVKEKMLFENSNVPTENIIKKNSLEKIKRSFKLDSIDIDSFLKKTHKYENSNTNSYSSEVKFNKQEQADLETEKDQVVNTEVKILDCYTPVKEKIIFENPNLSNENIMEKNSVKIKNPINIKSQVVIKPNGNIVNIESHNSFIKETPDNSLCNQLTNYSRHEVPTIEESQSTYSVEQNTASFLESADSSYLKSEDNHITDCSNSSVQRKRKRTRKRKKKVINKLNDSFSNNTFKFSEPKVESRPLMHIKFDTEDEDDESTKEPTNYLKQQNLHSNISNGRDKFETDLNYVEAKNGDANIDDDLLCEKGTMTKNEADDILLSNKTTHTNGDENCRKFIQKCASTSFMEVDPVDPEKILALPVVSRLPKIGDLISFKILKLSENYCPEISSCIIGKVQHYDPDTNDITMNIIYGMDQCTLPRGKFALELGDAETEIVTNIKNYNWTDFIEPKLHVLLPD